MFRSIALTLLCIGFGAAYADEGMWTYDNFPAAAMKAKYGWAPDQAWLDHARLSSLRLSVGCSASFISPEGLVMTNHHCARDCVGAQSTARHDYVASGFYAATLADERRCPDLEANQLIKIEDVTKTIDAATLGKTGKAFADAERAAIAGQERRCATADLHCQVVTLYHGGVYALYTYRRYQDLRLVWAVEDAAANFGGDPDNFNYPRYAIDSAFLRVYDHGKPLQPRDYLRFAAKPAQAGDAVLVSGNPGRTSREFTVAQLEYERDAQIPPIIALFSEVRGMLHQMGSEGAEAKRISLTTLFFVENDIKAYKGLQQALTEGPLMADKEKAEAELRRAVMANPELRKADGAAWDKIAQAVAHQRQIAVRERMLEGLPREVADRLRQAIELVRYAAETQKPNGARLAEYTDSNLPALKEDITSTAPDYAQLDEAMIGWWLTKLREDLGPDDADVHAVLGQPSPEQTAAEVVEHSQIGDPAFRAHLLAGGAAAIEASNDPMLALVRRLDGPARKVRADYENNVKAVITQNATLIDHARFALSGTSVYPDATFTLRLSYGAIAGYAEDGRQIAPFTDFAGAFRRATGNDPFALPPSWIRARPAFDPATPLDMVTTNDIVGGNSGSPVIDRDGDATGLIFDGDIQSLGGDYGYYGDVNRAVAVDITALKMALAKIYHADRLVSELSR